MKLDVAENFTSVSWNVSQMLCSETCFRKVEQYSIPYSSVSSRSMAACWRPARKPLSDDHTHSKPIKCLSNMSVHLVILVVVNGQMFLGPFGHCYCI